MSGRVNTTHKLIWSRIAVGRCSLRNTGCTNMVPGAPIESEIHTLWGRLRPLFAYAPRVRLNRGKNLRRFLRRNLFSVFSFISRDRLAPARPRFSFFFLSRFYHNFLAKRAPNKNLHNRPPFNRPPFGPGETLINEIHLPRTDEKACLLGSRSKLFRIFFCPFFFLLRFPERVFWMTADYKWHVAKFDEKERKGTFFSFFSSFFLEE